MEPAEQRNILLALVLFAVMMVGYQFLFPARKPQLPTSNTPSQQQVAQANAPLSFKLRDDIVNADIAAGKRVLIDAPSVDGSIWLVGSRIDDVSLKGFYDTVDAKLKQDRTQ